ncbi:MAG: hypothetical protein P8Z35_19645 [Ignavibacteriaceae bacterium]
MKKFLLFLLLGVLFIGCSEKSNFMLPVDQMEYRKIAYDSLSEEQKATLTTDWKEAEVEQGNYLLKDNINWIVFDSGNKSGFALMKSDVVLINNQPLVLVIFHTKVDALLGPIALIIEPGTKEIVGGFLRY